MITLALNRNELKKTGCQKLKMGSTNNSLTILTTRIVLVGGIGVVSRLGGEFNGQDLADFE